MFRINAVRAFAKIPASLLKIPYESLVLLKSYFCYSSIYIHDLFFSLCHTTGVKESLLLVWSS